MKEKVDAIIALVRAFFRNEKIVSIIKDAAKKAIDNQWSDGEKTQYVINAVTKYVESTPNPFDDIAVRILTMLYLKKYGA